MAEKFGKEHAHVLRTIKDLMIANPKMDALFISTTYESVLYVSRPKQSQKAVFNTIDSLDRF